ncbi:MAG TPA: hypothetical protein VNC60_07045 [Actinomycetota bacterium]|nr:hypothetical protein [Actinomycetota bacterium]
MQTPTRGSQEHAPETPLVPRRPASRFEHDLIVIPEAVRPRRWPRVAAVVAGVLALLLIVGLIAYASDQRRRAAALATQLDTAFGDQRAVFDTLAATRAQILSLEQRLAGIRADLRRARDGRSVLEASTHELRSQLTDVRAELDAERARFRSFVGAPIGDGSHVGRLVAVGADQTPARVTIDLGRWFTGSAATHAAIRDGVLEPGATTARYLRNEEVAWRTLPVDVSATVTVFRWNGGTDQIGFAELQRLHRSDSLRSKRIARDPFAVTVVDGRVTSFRQLRYA